MLKSESITEPHADATSIRPRIDKYDFSASYDQPTPAAYYRSLRDLDYRLPELARPFIMRCLDAIRRERGRKVVRVIDLCSGYGVNAALWNHEIGMDELYDRYAVWPGRNDSEEQVIERDRRWFDMLRNRPIEAEVIGVDVAANALDYARDVGLLQHALTLNLEHDDPGPDARKLLGGADMITVTGGLSYIGHATFERLLACFPKDCRPLVVWFPLRHTNVDPVVDTLDRFGLRTKRLATLPQRRFKDVCERRTVLRQLEERGLDPSDAGHGYSHAVCAISHSVSTAHHLL